MIGPRASALEKLARDVPPERGRRIARRSSSDMVIA
jgi:hypothetical protein